MYSERQRTARVTGAFYLALGIAGIVGFLVARTALYVPDDADATLANLADRQGLARLGIAAEMTTVVAQALVALWFYRLFRGVDRFAAGALMAFGFMNAVAILVGAMFTVTALGTARGDVPAPDGDQAATAQLMYEFSGAAWGVGELFFGLWLIPMGLLVARSGFMPRFLGRLLMVGGGVYLLMAYLDVLWPDHPEAVVTALSLVPTAGEFWIIGYLLIIGTRREAPEPVAP
jgi:hypothetical protein